MITAESHRTFPREFYMSEDDRLWYRAMLRVYRGAQRKRDRRLMFFAANVGHGTMLVRIS